ncbi:hypothetical protein [Winogradskyella jejuensis]|uniref:Peptidase family M50 n=1 Tax=Winogradskyella jejuensis TaxID=1089305 RepID=A0A1M5JJG9_9FLAO|nr:hypothetical protein [Winogradskyella jejuensis]SHG40707.1 hypothetical protein SAMN05444148_0051 [Winogradskyella jejuensis]
MLKLEFLPKFSLTIVIAFIAFTIIGTQLHEMGHVLVAKYYGYQTELYHDSMTYYEKGIGQDKNYLELKNLYEQYDNFDYESFPEDVKEKIKILNERLDEKYPNQDNNDGIYISLGGPLQTILTSLIGLSILLYRRKNDYEFKLLDWLSIFLALFILREIFNFCQAVFGFLLLGQKEFYGDEFAISQDLGFNQWLIPSIMLLIGVFISLWVIFKIIPLKYRFSFIVSGFVGGLLGFAIWFGFLGEFVFSYL